MLLVACGSVEDRAEEHFASAQELMAEGDDVRAMIELRNVISLVPTHVEARRAMGQILLEDGDFRGAFAQFLTLVELRPDDFEGRAVLAELAFRGRNWAEFERHAPRAVELAPDNPRAQIVGLALDYREAIREEDAARQTELVDRTEGLLSEAPGNELANQILLDGYVRAGDFETALQHLDTMIAAAPETRGLYEQRLSLLQEIGDRDRVEAHLRDVVALFPEETEAKSRLVQYLILRGDDDGAEAFLRSISDPTDSDLTRFLSLVQFLREVRGPEAARAELDAALEISPGNGRLRLVRAALDFETGQRASAIEDLEALLETSEDTAVLQEVRVTLARMLDATGNEVGAQRLVAEVLEDNPDNVDALKMDAAWAISADDTDRAISRLRRALDMAADDAEALSLMARAHTRAGSPDLARDFLAQAVEVSGNAPGPALQYAQILRSENNLVSAEEVLLPALRQAPSNVAILTLLGDIYLARQDFGRVAQAEAQLRSIPDDAADAAADRLEVQRIAQQQGTEVALAFLRDLASSEDADLRDRLSFVRAQLAAGEIDAARALAAELVAENPDNAQLRFALAMTDIAAGNLDDARRGLRALAEEDSSRVPVWQRLYQLLLAQGDVPGAREALASAIDANPGAPSLLWMRASEHESDGDMDAAIAIYEDLYAQDTSSVVFANNLASLLSVYRDDAASLERAWTVARRLRGTEIPAFQDTYGWLAFRRGDAETAIRYLEPASEGLPEDPIVRFHLAETYAALGRTEEAIAAYRAVLELAAPDDPRPQIDRARTAITTLESTPTDAPASE